MSSNVILLGMIFLAPAVCHGHHSFSAEFDIHTPVRLTGKVTKVELINPHAFVHVRVEKQGEAHQDWAIEAGSPNTLFRKGVNRDTLKVGTEIFVRGYQSKDHSCKPKCKANGRELTFPDGRKVFVSSDGTETPEQESDDSSL